MNTVVQAARESVLPEAERKGVQIVVSARTDGRVIGDSQRLQQVVWNLLSNAVKFSRQGSRVEVRLSADHDHVTIRVCDHGEGIDPAFLPHVFDRFRQADSSTTKNQNGLGLGLYIAKHLTELHGGELHATSDGIDRGAIFTLQLPAAPARASSAMRS
jgi:signal transduction histidine kinase